MPLSKLEALKRAHFTAEGKAERVAKALAALYQEERIPLSPEDWKWVAEDPDLEDQFQECMSASWERFQPAVTYSLTPTY